MYLTFQHGHRTGAHPESFLSREPATPSDGTSLQTSWAAVGKHATCQPVMNAGDNTQQQEMGRLGWGVGLTIAYRTRLSTGKTSRKLEFPVNLV